MTMGESACEAGVCGHCSDTDVEGLCNDRLLLRKRVAELEEMLGYAQSLYVIDTPSRSLRVDVRDPSAAYVIRARHGAGTEAHKHGPWPLREAFLRAKAYAADGDLKHLTPGKATRTSCALPETK